MGKGKGKGQAKAVVEERGFGAYPQYGQQAYPQGYPAYNQPPPGYPAGYPAQSYQQNPAYGGQYYGGRPQRPQQSSGGFLNGCLAALCCCCLADACIDF